MNERESAAVCEALIEVIERRKEYRECVDSCDTSPGYFCDRQRRAMEESLNDFGEALREFVLSVKAPEVI